MHFSCGKGRSANTLWAWLAVVSLVGIMIASPAFAVTQELELSGPEQSIDDFAEEWRRARKLMRACGYDDDFMSFLAFSEGVLLVKKAEDVLDRGGEVDEETRNYSIGHQDWFRPTRSKCKKIAKKLRPILEALSQSFDCFSIKLNREESDPPVECAALALYRAPRFK